MIKRWACDFRDFRGERQDSDIGGFRGERDSKSQRGEQADNLDQANQEIEKLRKHNEKLQAELNGKFMLRYVAYYHLLTYLILCRDDFESVVILLYKGRPTTRVSASDSKVLVWSRNFQRLSFHRNFYLPLGHFQPLLMSNFGFNKLFFNSSPPVYT